MTDETVPMLYPNEVLYAVRVSKDLKDRIKTLRSKGVDVPKISRAALELAIAETEKKLTSAS